MADHIFTDADMEANFVVIAEWLEELTEAIELGEPHPLFPLVWSNGAQVPFSDLTDEDRTAMVNAAGHLGWVFDLKLDAFEASMRATELMTELIEEEAN